MWRSTSRSRAANGQSARTWEAWRRSRPAGGLLFIGATNHDRKFHVYDKATGKLLWETVLPAAGNATPATYEIGGKQFVVIAAGGGKSGAASGGSYVAFALQ